jgi:hypothetical protein
MFSGSLLLRPKIRPAIRPAVDQLLDFYHLRESISSMNDRFTRSEPDAKVPEDVVKILSEAVSRRVHDPRILTMIGVLLPEDIRIISTPDLLMVLACFCDLVEMGIMLDVELVTILATEIVSDFRFPQFSLLGCSHDFRRILKLIYRFEVINLKLFKLCLNKFEIESIEDILLILNLFDSLDYKNTKLIENIKLITPILPMNDDQLREVNRLLNVLGDSDEFLIKLEKFRKCEIIH